MTGKLKKLNDGEYRLFVNDTPFATVKNSPYKRLSLRNCEAVFNGYDLDELAMEVCDCEADECEIRDEFKKGFQKALELLGDKKFSEEDMIKMFFNGRESLDKALVTVQEAKSVIQSLQQTEWDVEIVMENIYDGLDEMAQPQYSKQPKLDKVGCLILKRI